MWYIFINVSEEPADTTWKTVWNHTPDRVVFKLKLILFCRLAPFSVRRCLCSGVHELFFAIRLGVGWMMSP
jgi:hypothetical protein